MEALVLMIKEILTVIIAALVPVSAGATANAVNIESAYNEAAVVYQEEAKESEYEIVEDEELVIVEDEELPEDDELIEVTDEEIGYPLGIDYNESNRVVHDSNCTFPDFCYTPWD